MKVFPYLMLACASSIVVAAMGCDGGESPEPSPPIGTGSSSTSSTSTSTSSTSTSSTGGMTCSNEMKDGDESDVDCGGSCAPCALGKMCGAGEDCQSKSCQGGTCTAPACDDNQKNGDETDVDCGGSCPNKCAPHQMCSMGADCQFPQCVNGICADPSCSNGVKDGDETDRDCGGSCPSLCKLGQDCIVNADCLTDICSNGTCQGQGCTNGVKDNTETDIDCGGPDCAPCGLQKACKIGADCISVSCQNQICIAPTCMDSAQNGNETDFNCGGGTCPPCGVGKFCIANSDCTSGVCQGFVCQTPMCTDGVKNGNETDVDCGGTCPKCALGQTCNAATDCGSNACAGNKCTCPTKMVIVPIMGGGIACIDAYEATYSDYLAFYNANPSTANQPAECSWNVSYTPSGAWPPSPANLNEPVRYVDWCDAAAYCAFAGKHLCGALAGGPNAPADFADPTKSTWFDACSAQGNNDYPYGDNFSPVACNGAPALNVVVESGFATCLGGSPGLYHMSGNVAEWENSCTGAALPTDDCRVRGGSFQSSSVDLRCDADLVHTRDYAGPEVGFRCCL